MTDDKLILFNGYPLVKTWYLHLSRSEKSFFKAAVLDLQEYQGKDIWKRFNQTWKNKSFADVNEKQNSLFQIFYIIEINRQRKIAKKEHHSVSLGFEVPNAKNLQMTTI